LTDTGEHFLVNAQNILAQWESTLTFIQAEETLEKGALTIACSDTVMRYWLLPTIREFRSKYPGIRLSFLNRTSSGAQEAVLNGEADVAIALFQKDHPKLVHKKLFSYQEVAVVANGHPWGDQRYVTPHTLVKENLLLLEERTQTRQMFDRWLHSKQVTLMESMSLGSVEAQIELARIALGAAIVPDFACPSNVGKTDIRGLPKRQMACFYQRLKPASQAWLRLSAEMNTGTTS
jgi:DNA-binding transcriptional LysR family regulator